jgi:hypothetical protein
VASADGCRSIGDIGRGKRWLGDGWIRIRDARQPC